MAALGSPGALDDICLRLLLAAPRQSSNEFGIATRLAQQLVKINGLDLDLQIDAVEQWARNLAHVVGALVLVANAFLLGMPVVPARAWIHTRHEHERGGIFGRIFRP